MKKTLFTILIILAGIGIACLVFATDSGALSPQTMADDNATGTVAWSSPDNAKASDDVYATSTFNTAISHYLKATNFGFSILSGATIDGILVEIEKKASVAGRVSDTTVKIVKADATFGTENKALGGTWTTSDTYYSYGSSTDLWDETWTPVDINDADFGVGISGSITGGITAISVDHIRITVYYTEAGGGGQRVQIKTGRFSIQQGRVQITQ